MIVAKFKPLVPQIEIWGLIPKDGDLVYVQGWGKMRVARILNVCRHHGFTCLAGEDQYLLLQGADREVFRMLEGYLKVI